MTSVKKIGLQEPPPDPCAGDVFNWVASDPGFTDEIYQVKNEKGSVAGLKDGGDFSLL